MIAVIFEFWPVSERREDYFALAGAMREEIVGAQGFISLERFESLTEEGKVLSLSFWRDEAAVSAWRNRLKHRAAQQAGRAGIFKDYRLRVARVLRDYTHADRAQAPEDSRAAHATGTGLADIPEGL